MIQSRNQAVKRQTYVPNHNRASVYVLQKGQAPKRCPVANSRRNRLSVDMGFSTVRAGADLEVVFVYDLPGRTAMRRRKATVINRTRNLVHLRFLLNGE